MMIKKTMFLIAGVFLVLVGFVGLFLPVLQGLLMIFAGLFLVGEFTEIKFVENIKSYIHKKHKKKHL